MKNYADRGGCYPPGLKADACYFIIIIIFIHFYPLLVVVINIVVLCLVSFHAQSVDLMSIIITRQFSVIAVVIGHILKVLLLLD